MAARGHNRAMFQDQWITGPSSCLVSVIMERVVLANRWAGERWQAKGVICDGATAASGERTIVSRDDTTQLLFPGCSISLNREEAEGYFLNLSSPQPRIFVLWRLHEERARPDMLTVSYRSLPDLFRDLTACGARNSLSGRRKTLTGKRRFSAM